MKVRSTLYDTISGSIGNITGADGLGGPYLKDKPIPTNPNTTRQQAVRRALASAVVAWRGGTDANREAWERYGKTLRRSNQTGHMVVQNGWTAFAAVFVVFTQAGVATATLIANAPTVDGWSIVGDIRVAQETATANLQITNNNTDAKDIALYIGSVSQLSINRYGGSYQYNSHDSIAAAATRDVADVLKVGRNWFKFTDLDTTNNRISQPSYAQLDVASVS